MKMVCLLYKKVSVPVTNSLTNIYQWFIKLSWVQKLIVVVVVLLAASVLFKVLTPVQAPVQTEVLKSSPLVGTMNLHNIQFQGDYPQVPAQLSTATVEYADVNEQLLQGLLTAFSIPRTTASTNTTVWKGTEYQVAKTETPEQYIVMHLTTNPALADSTNGPNPVRAIEEAQKIIDGIYTFGPKPQALANQVKVLGKDAAAMEGQSDNQYIQVPFAFTIDDIPAVVSQDTVYAATITLDASYKLQKGEFRPYTLKFSKTQNYSTISASEAINRINKNQAAIIYYFYDGPNGADFSDVASGVLTKGVVEYRVDTTTNTASPYYKFSGTVTNSGGYDILTDIITPAIKTNFDAQKSQ